MILRTQQYLLFIIYLFSLEFKAFTHNFAKLNCTDKSQILFLSICYYILRNERYAKFPSV